MNESDPDQLKRVLIDAKQLFLNKNFQKSKQKLQSIKHQSLSIQTNLHLIQQSINRDNTDIVLKALMELLTQQNIKLYTERHISTQTNQLKQLIHVDHQYLYWNIIVIALKIGRPAVATLVANQASYFYGSFRSSTTFFILMELMKHHLQTNKIASCLKAYAKFQTANKLLSKKTKLQLKYATVCKTMFTRLLLKLGLIQEAQSKYNLDFGQQNQEAFEKINQQPDNFFKKQDQHEKLIQTTAQFPFKLIQQFMHAEIQFHDQKYASSMQILGTIISNQFQLEQKNYQKIKILAQNNVGIIMSRLGKKALAKKYFQSSFQKLSRLINENQLTDTQTILFFQRAKQNLMFSYLTQFPITKIEQISKNSPFFNSQNGQAYTILQNYSLSESYKLNYRKAQICLNHYHSFLQKSERVLPWEQIHDSYDTVYYYPNQPYVQQKSKNRNIYFTNKRHFYKRYVLLNSWDDEYDIDQEADRDLQRRKFQKQTIALKCKQILLKAQNYLRQALLVIQNQRQIATQKDGFDGDFKNKINQCLYQQDNKYKTSILAILCYVSLCLKDWSKCIKYGDDFLKNKGLDGTEDYFNVLTYLMQAYCQVSQFQQAYEITHKLVKLSPKDDILHLARDSIALHCCFYQNSSQFNTFFYNLAVLHSRDNHIIQAHGSIQKILSQMNLNLSNPNTNIPLPMADLLIHYYLRTFNYPAAIQMIKRKRTLFLQTMPSVGNFRPVMNITK